MADVPLLENDQPSKSTSYISTLFDRIEAIIEEHRQNDPDLYRLVEEKKLIEPAKLNKVVTPVVPVAKIDSIGGLQEPLYYKQYAQTLLKQKIAANQNLIREQVLATQSMIERRTKALCAIYGPCPGCKR